MYGSWIQGTRLSADPTPTSLHWGFDGVSQLDLEALGLKRLLCLPLGTTAHAEIVIPQAHYSYHILPFLLVPGTQQMFLEQINKQTEAT